MALNVSKFAASFLQLRGSANKKRPKGSLL